MKMFEYMAAGRAIISSDLKVIHEVLDENSAIFCPPEDINAWLTAINLLREKPDLRIKLGKSAREKVVQYSWKARGIQALEGFNPRKQ
jgi:glycosyltransferase involved in cell wall biosynthesis